MPHPTTRPSVSDDAAEHSPEDAGAFPRETAPAASRRPYRTVAALAGATTVYAVQAALYWVNADEVLRHGGDGRWVSLAAVTAAGLSAALLVVAIALTLAGRVGRAGLLAGITLVPALATSGLAFVAPGGRTGLLTFLALAAVLRAGVALAEAAGTASGRAGHGAATSA